MFQIRIIKDQARQLIIDANRYEATINHELVDFAQQLSAEKASLETARRTALEVYNSKIDSMVKQYKNTVRKIKATTLTKVPTYTPMHRKLQIGKNKFIYCKSIAVNLSALCKFKFHVTKHSHYIK